MGNIVKLKDKNGIEKYPVTSTQAIINDSNGKSLDELLGEKGDKIESIDGTSGAVTITLEPNKLYKLGACTSIEITLGAEIPNIYNEYMLQFTSSGVTTIGIPNGVKWSEFSDVSAIVANNIYQISIVGNLATIIGGKTE